ncbi:ATP-dependent DNA ligase [Verrucomicrobium sp. BvORR106]|uniref:ATP-dependent DNA ligase n=1 Tax=Verrucomicrobium sp. BvORR106 TaxID=1403819 RepID=UPI002240F7AF|nr:ATP-dependent DNA ligase [Verrucomicrobium sp. BvORR106]
MSPSSPRPIALQHTGGIYLPELDLWLDPHRPVGRAFVSHAHSDHFARHEFTLCSPVTHAIIDKRYGAIAEGASLVPGYGEAVIERGYELRLLPAGHILGSAMLHVTRQEDGATLLYTGDFKLRHGRTAEPAELRPAHTLIMETTFGLPMYAFPPQEQVLADIIQWARETLEDQGIPVLLGYSLGKAQEVLSAFHGASLPVMLHASIVKMTQACAPYFPDFPRYEKFDPATAAGHVLIMPPSAARSQAIRKLRVCRTAMLSGWALTPGAKYRYQVDEVFPLSDHADYPELIQTVEQVQPRQVYTVHGYTSEFARDLRERGWEAWSLVSEDQLELTLPGTATTTEVVSTNENAEDATEAIAPPPDSFAAWVQTCERVAADGSRLKKRAHLAEYLQQQSDGDLSRAVRWFSAMLEDPVLQLPPLQTGWSVIRRTLLELSGLREAEYRVISRSQADTGRTARLVLDRALAAGKLFPTSHTPATEVAGLFDRLRSAHGPVEKTTVLKEGLAKLPPLEGSYVVRLLTGELRVGSREGLVEEAIATAFDEQPDQVREAAMLCGDLGRAADLAARHELDSAQPELFIPVKVMLASPEETAGDIWNRLTAPDEADEPSRATATAPTTVWLEDKFDGIRAQLHRSAGRVEIYSRDLKRITDQFPEIATAASQLGDEVMLDGEIVAYAEDRKLSFFDLQKRLGRRDQGDLFISSSITVRYVVFDLIWQNGAGLLHEPLEERREKLEKLALPPLLKRIAVAEAASETEVEAAFHAARRNGNEGLIAKDRHSTYSPGRRGKSWLKLKKAFSTLDVVVVKAEQGHGKRSHVLSDYTFAVRDEHSGALKVIGKAYSGLSDVEIEELTEHFTEHTLSQRGSVRTVTPNIVLEIAFDSIQASQRHDSGLALRFPRIKAIRRDKGVDEIDTLTYARKLAGK